MPRLPNHVEVGHRRYRVTVSELDRLRIQQNEEVVLYGHADHGKLTITLDDQQASGIVRETFVHEVLHAIFTTFAISHDWKDGDEEAAVSRLAPALLDTLRRNPGFVAYILQSDL